MMYQNEKIRFGSTYQAEPGCVRSVSGEIGRWQKEGVHPAADRTTRKAAETVAQSMQALLRSRGDTWLYDASVEREIVHEVLKQAERALQESGFSPEEHTCVRVGSAVGLESVHAYVRLSNGLSIVVTYKETLQKNCSLRLAERRFRKAAACRDEVPRLVFLEAKPAHAAA